MRNRTWQAVCLLAVSALGAKDCLAAVSRIAVQCHQKANEYRSRAVLRDFDRLTHHRGGWPGHVRDHICPLACGGEDAVENLQWQTVEEAAEKDRIERTPAGYRLFCE